jgi:small ligand-binding sensory domain FIST
MAGARFSGTVCGMPWASAAAEGTDLDDLAQRCLDHVATGLGGPAADVAFVFASAAHRERAPDLAERLAEALGGATVLGCTAGGVLGGGRELEQVPALALLAGRIPGAAAHAFALAAADLPDPDAPPLAWHQALGVSSADRPSFVVVADPFSFPADALLSGLDYAYPGSVTVGGLASGARQAGEQVLLAGDRAFGGGAVGLALMGGLDVVPAVAQGCRPVGPTLRITGCERHLLSALEGRPALEALGQVLAAAEPADRKLAETSLFLGFETDPFSEDTDAPWLIRNLLGVEPQTRGLYVGEHLRSGRRVRFHVRDRHSSAEDLQRTLARAAADAAAPAAALLFSCLGRGAHLYGTPDHDTRAFERRFAGVPLGGFFCSGEIGPVGGATRVHGFTSSFGLLVERPA